MKSLVEAASSIFKAIEKGWERAGKPQEFTVKILEEGKSGFLGFTGTPAKVALFFVQETVPKKAGQERQQKQPDRAPQKQPRHRFRPHEGEQRRRRYADGRDHKSDGRSLDKKHTPDKKRRYQGQKPIPFDKRSDQSKYNRKYKDTEPKKEEHKQQIQQPQKAKPAGTLYRSVHRNKSTQEEKKKDSDDQKD